MPPYSPYTIVRANFAPSFSNLSSRARRAVSSGGFAPPSSVRALRCDGVSSAAGGNTIGRTLSSESREGERRRKRTNEPVGASEPCSGRGCNSKRRGARDGGGGREDEVEALPSLSPSLLTAIIDRRLCVSPIVGPPAVVVVVVVAAASSPPAAASSAIASAILSASARARRCCRSRSNIAACRVNA